MNRLAGINAPGLSGPADEDSRISERVQELLSDWNQDAVKLAEAANYVTGATSWCDHLPQDVASLMLGHPDDQAARDARFMADLRQRVTDRLLEMAQDQAEKESQDWMPWRDVQRLRARRYA